MNIEELREFCLSLKASTESLPFGDDSLVLKVQGKMFALIPLKGGEVQISLKCNPERAISLREEYSSIVPGWHFNKKHWNTVFVTSQFSTDFLCELITHSYQLVVDGLPKKLREELNEF